jgi:hypothetical protein
VLAEFSAALLQRLLMYPSPQAPHNTGKGPPGETAVQTSRVEAIFAYR